MTIKPKPKLYYKLNDVFSDVSKLESTIPNYLHEVLTEDDYSILNMLYGWNNEKAEDVVLQGRLMNSKTGSVI